MKFISFMLLLLFLPSFLMAENYADYLPEKIKKEKNKTWIDDFSNTCNRLAEDSRISPVSFNVLKDSLADQKFPESPDQAAALFFFYAAQIDHALKSGSSRNTVMLTVRNNWKQEMEKQEKEKENREKSKPAGVTDEKTKNNKSLKERSRAPEVEIKKDKLKTKIDKVKKDKKEK